MEEDLDQISFEFNEDPITGEISGAEDVEISFDLDELELNEHYDNLAETLDEDELEDIGREAVEMFEADMASREDWEMMTTESLENLGLILNDSQEPFDGACTATHPLILEAVVKFQSKASNELCPAKGPALTKTIGKETPEIQDQAQRVKTDMNYVLQEEIEEYYDETEKSLFFTGLIGNGFKRKYYDPIKGRICDEMCFPDKIVVNNLATSLMKAERISYLFCLTGREIDRYIDEAYFSDEDFGEPTKVEDSEFSDILREIQGISSESKTYDHVYQMVEQHCYLKLPGDDYEKPYVVTVERHSKKVASIRRNWEENDDKHTRLEWFTHYSFVPTAGFYALGYAQLLGNLQKSLTVAMRSLVDAGMFANMPGGFKRHNARIIGNNGPHAPGEFKDIEVPATVQRLEDVFMGLPFKEPSAVLFSLMEKLENSGQQFADSVDQVVAEGTNYGPVGTTMALLEASTKFFAAVYKRMFFAQKNELKIVARLIKDYGDSFYAWDAGEFQGSRHQDYDSGSVKIIPVADPNYSSQAQRLAKAQAMVDSARQAPQLHDMKAVYRDFHKALGNENVDLYIPPEEQAQKLEPMADIQALINGKPIQAFPEQDHSAHIAVKTAFLQNQMNQEVFAQYRDSLTANIQEHTFMLYQSQVEALTGQGFSVAQAAQRLNRLNEIAQEEASKGSPASRLADAEVLKAQVDLMKEQREERNDKRDLGLKLLDTAVKQEREINRATEKERQMDLTEEKMALDLIREGLKNSKDG